MQSQREAPGSSGRSWDKRASVFWKFLQRRMYSILNTNVGLAVTTILFLLACYYVTMPSSDPALQSVSCEDCSDYRNNIGGVDAKQWFAYEPIDVVYTWVNGSDPVWMKKKDYWTEMMIGTHDKKSTQLTAANITNSSLLFNHSFPELVSNETDAHDDTNSNNRYRDSEELRYSLRSLIKNAPWIRKIYLVTDNQVPYWLNLDNGDRLTIISHYELFENKSVLPVFSSPAIETQLHKIPGLSQKFIYFNDDVFLGSPVYPDDFVSLSGAQKFYMSWDVPKCAPGCSDSWIGDGVCDKACNVSECDFDYPDCVNATSTPSSTINTGNSPAAVFCYKGCPDSWLADKVCDVRCKVEECGWDIGDCGLDLVQNSYKSVYISESNSVVTFVEPGSTPFIMQTNETISNSTEDSVQPAPKIIPAMRVAIGTKALFFNTSFLPCKSTSDESMCNATEKAAFTYTLAEHYDDGVIVHSATLLSRHHALVVILFSNQEDAPPRPPLPHFVKFIVGGYNSITNKSLNSVFHLKIEPDRLQPQSTPLIPANMGEISGFLSSCTGFTGGLNAARTHLAKVPFRVNGETPVEGISIDLHLRNISDYLQSEYISDYSTYLVATESSGRTFMSEWPLIETIADHLPSGAISKMFQPAVTSEGDEKSTKFTFSNLVEKLNKLVSIEEEEELVPAGDKFTPLSLLLPSRVLWNSITEKNFTWVHTKVVIAKKSHVADLEANSFESNSHWNEVSCEDVPEESSNSSETQNVTKPAKTICDIEKVIANKFQAIQAKGAAFCHLVSYKWGNRSAIISVNTSVSEVVNASETTSASNSSNSSDNSISRRLLSHSIEEPKISASLDDGERIISKNLAIKSRDFEVRKKRSEHFDYERQWRRHLTSQPKYENFDVEQKHVEHAHQHVKRLEQSSFLSSIVQFVKSKFFRESVESRNHRRLLDTYAASLVHVNRIYNKEFGYENRKVPAHMPHMIDKTVMTELQARYPAKWNETSYHRFRSPTDMQYSFSYYYYAMNRNKASPPDISKYIRDEVDSNKDGVIDDNEFRTLASIVYAKSPSKLDIELLHNCSNTTSDSYIDYQESVNQNTHFGNLRKTFALRLFPKIAEVANCSIIVNGIRNNVDWTRYRPTHTMGLESQIAFEMIGDNFTETLKQLDSVRQRQSKFVCINDNMKSPSAEMVQALKDFYLSFFPFPCKFELPDGVSNPSLYWDDYKRSKQQSNRFTKLRATMASHKESARNYVTYLAKKLIEVLENFVSDEDQSEINIVILNSRKEMLSNTPSIQRKSNKRTFFGAFTIILSLVGISFIFGLRYASKRSELKSQNPAAVTGPPVEKFKIKRVQEPRFDSDDDDDDGYELGHVDDDDSDEDRGLYAPRPVNRISGDAPRPASGESSPTSPSTPLKSGMKKGDSAKKNSNKVRFEDDQIQQRKDWYPGKFLKMGMSKMGNKNGGNKSS